MKLMNPFLVCLVALLVCLGSAQVDYGANIACAATKPATTSDEDLAYCHKNIDEEFYPDMTQLFNALMNVGNSEDYVWSVAAYPPTATGRRQLVEQHSRELQQSSCPSQCKLRYGLNYCVEVFGCPRYSRRRLRQRSTMETNLTDAEMRLMEDALVDDAVERLNLGVWAVDPVRCGEISYDCSATLCYQLPTVVGFTLVDAPWNTDNGPIVEGMTIALSEYGDMAVRVEGAGPVESVVISVDGAASRTENGTPYSVAGDYSGWLRAVPEFREVGVHVITATPYSEDNGKGTEGLTSRVVFIVSAEPFLTPTVVQFTLVAAGTNEDNRQIQPNDIVFLHTLGPAGLNIRADVGGTAASVVFHVNGQYFRTDNAAPFSLAGDILGNYHALGSLPFGAHQLTATPFTGVDGTGTGGNSLTIGFTFMP